MTNALIRFIFIARLIAEVTSAAKLVFLWGIALLTDLCPPTSEPIPAIVVIDIGFGTPFENNMSADFS